MTQVGLNTPYESIRGSIGQHVRFTSSTNTVSLGKFHKGA